LFYGHDRGRDCDHGRDRGCDNGRVLFRATSHNILAIVLPQQDNRIEASIFDLK